jgi:outer membrane receptor protein involved in Fe transport
VITKDLVVKAYGTYQKTQLKKAMDFSPDAAILYMLLYAQADTITYSSTYVNPTRIDETNTATPSFYGGLIVNYNFKEKVNLNVNTYYYSKQEFKSKYSTENIDAKLIMNLKLSYKVVKNTTLFVNVRNILVEEQEFAYMDKMGLLFLGGLTFNY